MNDKMESIEINIPTSTPTKPETGTKSGAKKIWVQIQSVWEFCKEDTGREIFALKVGVTVLVVSLFVLFEAPYQVFGFNIIWAILTAILVFEDTVGATFNRGFNRAVGTLVAVILAVVVAETALSCGHVAEPIILGLSMFMIAVITSYMKMWAPLVEYEYGFRVTLLTYCLIVVSDYRIGNPIRTMIDRLYSIAIGGTISVLVNVCIFPIWAGDQLHKELVKNFHSVANSLEECTKKYLEDASEKTKITEGAFHDEPAYMRCESTLDSGSRFETLAKSAKWEPPHGRFMHISYPWLQYVKVGAVLRHCAYEVMALHSIVNAKIQVPYKLRAGLESEVEEASKEAAEVVRILGRDISRMQWSLKDSHIERLHNSVKRLQSCMSFQYSFMLAASTFDNPSKSFANISHMFFHFPYQREMEEEEEEEEEVECYHHDEITGKQLRRLYSWPPREADAFEEDSEKNIKLRTLESSAMLSFTNFASSLMEFVARVEHLVEAVHELSKMAKFKSAL